MSNSTTRWQAESYSKNARFVSDLGEPLLELLEARPGERILDLGCGDGALTERITAAEITVIGVDASHPLLKAARQRRLDVAQMDGQCLGLKQRFDAVFSNAALHWMKRPQSVIEGVAGCLKPGGRFVGELGSRGNVERIRRALHDGLAKRGIDPWRVDPWYFPSPEEYARLLSSAGFTIASIELTPRPTRLPGDLRGWLDVFAQPFTRAVPEPEIEEFVDEVTAALKPMLQRTDGSWHADYVRLRFKAIH